MKISILTNHKYKNSVVSISTQIKRVGNFDINQHETRTGEAHRTK